MAVKVYIVYYSMYGHVETLAREIQKGANSVEGVEATLYQVPETLPQEVPQTQSLAGKPAGIFVSPASQGGQETTALTAITQLTHHGMIFVPVGCTFGAGMSEINEPKGGSSHGAGTLDDDAFHQGKYTAGIVKKLKQ
uniref:Flavodoxin-like domain-containing protein n=1 Tax=Physcomitrium patens TaxID=3218 RepID=A0A2K1KMY3_PHYPA|nr:hypothetical protein PHYPA_006028 [Physcomitrium patens]